MGSGEPVYGVCEEFLMTCPDCAIKEQEIADLKQRLKEARTAELNALRAAQRALDQRDEAIAEKFTAST